MLKIYCNNYETPSSVCLDKHAANVVSQPSRHDSKIKKKLAQFERNATGISIKMSILRLEKAS